MIYHISLLFCVSTLFLDCPGHSIYFHFISLAEFTALFHFAIAQLKRVISFVALSRASYFMHNVHAPVLSKSSFSGLFLAHCFSEVPWVCLLCHVMYTASFGIKRSLFHKLILGIINNVLFLC